MLNRARKNCAAYRSSFFSRADITALDYPDDTFDKIVAENVLHLPEEPSKVLIELNRVCRAGGILIIPTYINHDRKS